MTDIFAKLVFALTLSVAPGPVNLITLSTGLNHGARSALGFVFGATAGFTLLLALIGLGAQAVADQAQAVFDVLAVLGAGLILYFGVGLLRSDGAQDAAAAPVPSAWQGAALQWLNPKAWGACLASVSLFDLQDSPGALWAFVAMYFVACFVGVGSWALFGAQAERWLNTAARRRVFNRILGSILCVMAALFLLQGLR
ncbi:LysE family translocator [Thalassobius sp. S69A]|uniref:LysE family translocator n=1 Tax=unclassified Thalassovita TaxID=2619711 RepID=UPI003C79E4EB